MNSFLRGNYTQSRLFPDIKFQMVADMFRLKDDPHFIDPEWEWQTLGYQKVRKARKSEKMVENHCVSSNRYEDLYTLDV